MYTKCLMTKLMKNYQLFTFCWFKSLYTALTNMRHQIAEQINHTLNTNKPLLLYKHGQPCSLVY